MKWECGEEGPKPGSEAAAAPATVSGEPTRNEATGNGKARGVAPTREPGDQPEQKDRGRRRRDGKEVS